MMDQVTLCKCPICGKDARALDSTREVPDSLRGCDSNETYKCYTARDNKSLRYVLRQKQQTDIDWSEVERIEKGLINKKQ